MQHPWHTTLIQSLVCYTLIEVYRILICKKPHANTLMVRTWDLMLPRPSLVLVTNPDMQLPCHLSKTVLRIPSTDTFSLFYGRLLGRKISVPWAEYTSFCTAQP